MDQIICHIEHLETLHVLEPLPESAGSDDLKKLGFTGVILPKSESLDLGLEVESSDLIHMALNLDELLEADSISSDALWNTLEPGAHSLSHLRFSGTSPMREQAALMLQMSLPFIPILDRSERMIPGTAIHSSRAAREYRELLRSLTFWRTRFYIGRQQPRLVHADHEGLLIYIIDSWLIALNFNREDASIDIGTGGAMWLMLATGHDVHLHGSLLDLPSNSGAILANELAR